MVIGGGGDGANVNRDDISATAGVHGRGVGGGGGGQVIGNPNFGKEGGGGVIYIQYPALATHNVITVPSPRGPLANTYTANTGDSNTQIMQLLLRMKLVLPAVRFRIDTL